MKKQRVVCAAGCHPGFYDGVCGRTGNRSCGGSGGAGAYAGSSLLL